LTPSSPPNDYGQYKGSAANHHFVIDEVVRNMRYHSPCITTPEDGRAVVEIIENIHLLKK